MPTAKASSDVSERSRCPNMGSKPPKPNAGRDSAGEIRCRLSPAMQRVKFKILWTLLASLLPSVLLAQDFPPVTQAELTLDTVPNYPDVPAAILLKRATVRLADATTGKPSSLEILVRTKVLTEAGKEAAQVAIGHSAGTRLVQFEGRTVLPDGSEVALDTSEVFTERLSAADQRFLTKAALPAVEVGAVLDYQFQLQWTSPHVEPLVIEDGVPIFLAELSYEHPANMRVDHYVSGPLQLTETRDRTAKGHIVRLTAAHIPPLLEEPYSFPRNDLVTQLMVIPRSVTRNGQEHPILNDWSTVTRPYRELYKSVGAPDREIRAIANYSGVGNFEIEEEVTDPEERFEKRFDTSANLVPKDPRERLENVYRWIRDELASEGHGVGVGRGTLLDVLRAEKGTPAENALLLQAILQHFKMPADLVWAVDWRDGFVDLAVPHPRWFAKVLVRTELDGQETWLDPSDRRLALGHLSPLNEGTKALVLSDPPEIVDLPISAPSENMRRADIALQLDDEGRVSGRGRLALTGHHAWIYLGVGPASRQSSWQEWLDERLEGFKVENIQVSHSLETHSLEKQGIDITFDLRQQDSDVLGDEVSLLLSRPLGPSRQRYTQEPSERRQAVQVSYADRDEIEVLLRWPEGWSLDVAPDDMDLKTSAGLVQGSTEVDEEGRKLIYRRVFEINGTRYEPGAPFEALRNLYNALEPHDAQSVVLVLD